MKGELQGRLDKVISMGTEALVITARSARSAGAPGGPGDP